MGFFRRFAEGLGHSAPVAGIAEAAASWGWGWSMSRFTAGRRT